MPPPALRTGLFLIIIMLEAYDWNSDYSRVPASLIFLVRHRLCGVWPDLYREHLAIEKRQNAAINVGVNLPDGEKVSINKLARLARVTRSTAARWLADPEFDRWIQFGRRLATEGAFTNR